MSKLTESARDVLNQSVSSSRLRAKGRVSRRDYGLNDYQIFPMRLPEMILLQLLLVPHKRLWDGVGLQLLAGGLVHPQLAVALLLHLDPILGAPCVQDERWLLGMAVTHY